MRKRELLKRWGIFFLSIMVISGTAPVSSAKVFAEEAGSLSTGEDSEIAQEVEPEPESQPENGTENETEQESESETVLEEESGGEEDNAGTGGGAEQAQADPEEESGAGDSEEISTVENPAESATDDAETGSTDDSGNYAADETETGDTGSASYSTSQIAQETEDLGLTTTENAAEAVTAAAAEAASTAVTVIVDVTEEPEGYSEADNYNGTNEELIAEQNIVTDLPEIRRDFRFTTVDAAYAFSAGEMNIYEERDESAQVVGTIVRDGILYELESEEDGWIYVESGDARGFVREEELIRGEEAEAIMEVLETQAARISAMLPEGVSKEHYCFTAKALVPYYENEAYAFRRITARDVVISAETALAKADTGVMEECSDEARTVGSLEEGDLVYVIEDAQDGWLFVESGDVRGFVPSKELDRSNAAKAQIEEEGETSFSTAAEVITYSENKALYYSMNSVREGAKYNEIREKILEKALSCVGNPYVWGGTSLTNGADCSGFVQTLYRLFGYSIPRVAEAQSRVGTQIPVSDAAPGDLIFFARNGYVYHVAMYAGDGKTVEAYSSQYGIITKELSDRNAVWATRIIEDEM